MSDALISAESKKDNRTPIGKLKFTWTDPYIDPEIEVVVLQENRVSYKKQVADLVDETPRKWFSINSSVALDGTFFPMPGTEIEALSNQVGWWGSVNSDISGEFVTDPLLLVLFANRPVFSVVIAGDNSLGEYPVDFTVDVMIGDTIVADVLATQTITGNTQHKRVLDFGTNINNATIIRLIIHKWSKPAAVVKITEFYSSIVEEYFSDDINSFSILEETDGTIATVPVGNISANNIDVELQNIDKKFTAFNENTDLYRLIKRNRKVEAFVGFNIGGVDYYTPKGVYWTGDWRFGEQEAGSSFSGVDRLGLLRDIIYQGFSALEDTPAEATYWLNKSLWQILTDVLTYVKENNMPDLFWDIDNALKSDMIDTGFFSRKSVFEVIKEVAQAGLAYAYMDKPTDAELAANPAFMVDILRVKKVTSVIPEITEVVVANEYEITEDDYLIKTQTQDTSSVVNSISIMRKTFFIDDTEEGKPPVPKELADDRYIYTVENNDSIRANGVIELEYPKNDLIQSEATIAEIGENILQTFADANANVELNAFGDPTLKIADRVVYPQFTDGEFERLAYMAITGITTEYNGFLRIAYKGRKLFEIPDEVLIDGDGNEYTTVVIGNQEWSVENWRSTSYMDGTAIPNVTDNAEWGGLSTPAYCFYGNSTDAEFQEKNGALYNWFVTDPHNEKKLAPVGWRIPTEADWVALEAYLVANGFNWDGTTTGNKIGKAMASNGGEWTVWGTEGRPGNDQASNNSSGFTGLPGGARDSTGNIFFFGGSHGLWWSTTEFNASSAYHRYLQYNLGELNSSGSGDKRSGYSIRLVRDI